MKGLTRKTKIALSVLIASAGAIASYGRFADSRNLSRHLDRKELQTDSSELKGDEISLAFVKKYSREIASSSERYGLFPEVVAAIIMAQNHDRPRYEDWKDEIASRLNFDKPSLGTGQVKVKTAGNLDKMFHGVERTGEKLEERLETPKRNIGYVAMAYRDLLDEQDRLPSMNIDSALDNPHLLAVTASEYQRGPSKNPIKDANPNSFRLMALAYLATVDFNSIFSNARITENHRRLYWEYLAKHITK